MPAPSVAILYPTSGAVIDPATGFYGIFSPGPMFAGVNFKVKDGAGTVIISGSAFVPPFTSSFVGVFTGLNADTNYTLEVVIDGASDSVPFKTKP